MADLGLLGGLAEGLRSGIDAYRTERAYGDQKRKDALEQAFKKAQLQELGYDVGQDGSPVLSEFGSLKKNLATTQAKRSLESYDPNSETSQRQVQSAQGLLSAADPDHPGRFDGIVAPGTSAADLQEQTKEGLLGKTLSGVYSTQGRLVTANRVAEGNEIKRQGLNLRKDNQAQQVAGVFDNDHILKTLQGQQQQIQRDKHTVENADILTPQMADEIAIGIANSISGGRSSAVSTQQKVEWDSAAKDWTKLKQRITNKPEDIKSPEVKKYFVDMLERLESAYQQNMESRAKQIAGGRSFQFNDHAQKTMENKVGEYSRPLQEQSPGLIKQGNKVDADDQALINFAVANPNDPRSAAIKSKYGIK